MDYLLHELIKILFSAPFFILIFFIVLILVIVTLQLEIFRNYKNELKSRTKCRSLFFLTSSILVFILSAFFLFYKLVDIPAGAFDEDDGAIVIGAAILKNFGHDSIGKNLPYFPYIQLKYHGQIAISYGLCSIPLYLQSFLQYFLNGSFFSIRLESTILMLLSSILVGYSLYLIKSNAPIAILCSSMFNLLPWTRILARITPQTTVYCFISSSLLFSILYLYNKKKKLGLLLYLLSLVLLFLSYQPGLLMAPLIALLLPLSIKIKSDSLTKFCYWQMFLSLLLLSAVFLALKNELGFKESMGKAISIQGLIGISTLDFISLIKASFLRISSYIANYLGYLLPHFLFLTGDSNLRHNTGYCGQFFTLLLIPFYCGLALTIQKVKMSLNHLILLAYLLIATIPAATCLEGGLEKFLMLPLHALRSSCILPVITIIIFLGISELKKRRIFFILYLTMLSCNIYGFYYDYFLKYPERVEVYFNASELSKASKEAIRIIKQYPEKKLFYSCPHATIIYNNLNEIKAAEIANGNGLLANIYSYGDRAIEKGDLILVQEPWSYGSLNKKFRVLFNVPNKTISASLLEITE